MDEENIKHLDGEEIINDEFTPEDEEGNPALALKKLRQKLAQAQKEKQEYLLGWQRAKADFVNAKKNLQTDMASVTTFAEGELISELLPVLDSFYAARKNKTTWESVSKDWRIGVEYIEQQLMQTLKSHGLEVINPEDKIFNHDEHEAVEEISEGEPGHIIEVLQLGYKLKGKVIRAARVKVAK